MKVCSHCKQEKPHSEFFRKQQSPDGYDWWCKECWREYRGSKQRYTDTPLSPAVKQSIHRMLSTITNRARKKHLKFDLLIGDIAPLFEEFCANNDHSWQPRHPFRPSIDRVDNSRGYTLDNIRIVWYIENICRNKFSDEDVAEFCRRRVAGLEQREH